MSPRDSICAPNEKLEASIREAVGYDPETGLFTWKRNAGRGLKAGDVAGATHRTGYIELRIGLARLAAHRVAWWLTHGRWPTRFIDHINGKPSDNRIANLREANDSQNTVNRLKRKPTKTGYIGVQPAKSKSGWAAKIRCNGKLCHLGTFATAEEAARAYDAKAREVHGEFAVFNFVG